MATFLQAEWRKLLMANYAVDPEILKKYVPAGTELDLWNNTCYVSLVGFMFLNTSVLGMKIPFHVNFEEVNLRFYVRHYHDQAWRRGVVFIKEIVPRAALTFVANTVYGEHYETMPMTHEWIENKGNLSVDYRWKQGTWHSIKAACGTALMTLDAGSEEEFITEHYWGYTKRSDSRTTEYGVEHPRWHVYPLKSYSIDVDFGQVYGNTFAFLSNEKPKSVFLAEGSEIKVLSKRTI
jgi:uncharacterized protein YqjF (DUF2071 family)